jgi:hypothetical protein
MNILIFNQSCFYFIGGGIQSYPDILNSPISLVQIENSEVNKNIHLIKKRGHVYILLIGVNDNFI